MTQTISLDQSHLIKLEGTENIDKWKRVLISALKIKKLTHYVLTDVPKPKAQVEMEQWEHNRAVICHSMLLSLLEEPVYSILINNGWDPDDENPFAWFRKVLATFQREEIPIEAVWNLQFDLMGLDRDDFDDLHELIGRVQYLRRKLEDMAPGETSEPFLLSMVTDAMQMVYPNEYRSWDRDIQSGQLDWNRLMCELTDIAEREKHTERRGRRH